MGLALELALALAAQIVPNPNQVFSNVLLSIETQEVRLGLGFGLGVRV